MAESQSEVINKGFQNAGKGIDSILGAAFNAVNRAEKMRKHSDLEFLEELSKLPAVKFDFGGSIIGIDKPLKVQAHMPVFTMADLTSAALDTMTVDMSLDIQDHQESEVSSDTAMKADGTAKIGIGPIGAKVHISASVGVHTANKRSTDQRAHVGMQAILKRTEPPEGVSLITDAGNVIIHKLMDMNQSIIEGQVQQMQADVNDQANAEPEVEQLGAPDEDGDGQGGDSGGEAQPEGQ